MRLPDSRSTWSSSDFGEELLTEDVSQLEPQQLVPDELGEGPQPPPMARAAAPPMLPADGALLLLEDPLELTWETRSTSMPGDLLGCVMTILRPNQARSAGKG